MILISIAWQAFASPAFSIAPGVLHADLKHQRTYVFILQNTGDKLIHLRIHPDFFTVQSKTLAAGKSLVSDKQQRANSLVPYTIVSPQVLSLQPTEQRDVRVSINLPPNAKPGTYREHIVAKMMEIAEHVNSSKSSNLGVHLDLLMQIAPVVYADVGHNQAKLHITCSKNSKGNVELHVFNPSPWHYSGFIEGYTDNMNKPVLKMRAPVFRHSTRDFDSKWKANGKLHLMWRNEMVANAPTQTTICNIK